MADAIRKVASGHPAVSIGELVADGIPGRRITFSRLPSNQESGSVPQPPQPPQPPPVPAQLAGIYGYVQDAAINHYAPRLFPEDPVGLEDEPLDIEDMKVLFIIDQPDQWGSIESSGMLDLFEYTVVCPTGANLTRSVGIDLSSDESLRSSMKSLDEIDYNVVVAMKNLDGYPGEGLLGKDLTRERAFVDLLFGVCRHAYERIGKGKVRLISLCLNAYLPDGQLNPFTGLVSGFMKSLGRELPDSTCRIINTDETNHFAALQQIEIELRQPQGTIEVCYRDGKRYVVKLTPVERLSSDDRTWLDSDSVVLATGGGRGVTATLVEELLRRFGCKVIALGRTDPASAPEAIAHMDEGAFREYEAEFYRNELAKNPKSKIPDLKSRYLSYQAVNELNHTIKRMERRSGTFQYLQVDLNDEEAVSRAIQRIYRDNGRLDLVLHGAGVQISKVLTRKSLEDFRRIVFTKLGSLGYIYRAARRYGTGKEPHFHLLTSAFSYLGNDGQPDYGAANEAMNRVAAAMSAARSGSHWSSMAWLGWAGIGMTRNSEYAALAANRGLRGVSGEEGQRIFSSLVGGSPAEAINVMLTKGEIEYYGVAIEEVKLLPAVPSILSGREARTVEWSISTDNTPFLMDHLVNGVPTVPAALLNSIVVETARRLRPDLKLISIEDTTFRRFIKVHKNRTVQLRLLTEIVADGGGQAIMRIRILSDFVHKSGVVLEGDILHNETTLRLAREAAVRPALRFYDNDHRKARLLPDPYVMEGSPVRLKGPFDCLSNIEIGEYHRKASYRLKEYTYPDSPYLYMLPNMIMIDCFWRFCSIHASGNGHMPVYVPDKCGAMNVYFDFHEFSLPQLKGALIFIGENPRDEGDLLHLGRNEVRDLDGNLLVVLEGGSCRRYGEVPNAGRS